MKEITDEVRDTVFECAEIAAIDVWNRIVEPDGDDDEAFRYLVREIARASFEGLLGFYQNDEADADAEYLLDAAAKLADEYSGEPIA